MIDSKTIEQARNTDIIAFFEKHCGFTFAHRGGAYRCQQHPSLAVKNDRLSFYWHSKSVGGFGALDYLVKVENMPFREALEAVTGIAPMQVRSRQEEPPKTLVLPEKAGIPLKLYDYLCTKRGIDSDIVNALIQKKMLYEDKRGNVVFLGYDEHNKARFASVRGTQGDFRGDCYGSDKRYGFNTAACAPSGCLYVFESPIDLLSHATLAVLEEGDKTAWEYDKRLSLAGTTDTAIPSFLNQHKAVKELVFCLDNDAPGREAATAMVKKYADKGYKTRIALPRAKDYNMDLIDLVQKIRLEKTRKDSVNIHNDMCI